MPSRIYVPAIGLNDWQRLLAEPDKHWRTGYSAKSLAYCWMEADGFPAEVRNALEASSEPSLHGLELLFGAPEHEVPLPGGRKPSQNDIWVLARGANGLVSVAVEGKVAEPFDKTVAEWAATASPGRETRLAYLCETLAVDPGRVATIRYQLLHRTASAIIEARRFCCSHAVMLVHSFSQTHQWFEDFAAFGALYGVDIAVGEVRHLVALNGVGLSVGWVTGDRAFLSR